MFKDYYAVLDVSPRASGDDIRTAFRRLALLYHPDRAPAGGVEAVHGAQPKDGSLPLHDSPLFDNNSYTNAAISSPLPPQTEVPLLCISNLRAFTDIQEAYEVLGDVARRYLYDLNYQEALLEQERQRQEEVARREAHVRAVEEATRHARERERRRQLHTQALSQTRLSASPLLCPANHVGPSPPTNPDAPSPAAVAVCLSSELPPNTRVQHVLDSSEKQTCAGTVDEHTLEDVEVAGLDNGGDGIGSRDTVYSSTAPLLSSMRHRQRGSGDGWDRGGFSKTASNATTTARSRLPPKRLVLPSQITLSASSTFLIANPISSAAEPHRASTSTLSTRAAGGRYGGMRDTSAELPMEYYLQRSIERTFRVFFGVSKAT
ncbi:chaperone protein DNAJ putatative [Leptomonas pyrrhocoris]|uniref:Chaperone protein DNAJ putatative n=1 Tax=Leptomonas pyrrhocoris TaxID=157538 RepID=A0A0M9GAS6_LEPPY|nr:chaperone protein DNAJ putatative [Leptomonas pyrrhocoris]XP_015664929.1 chaperone protein DNAJ putatative [Leptomonas pyrrhocoris]KPA86489.1 chaperone protein DNAJ putatative [Leptomonas pyrrhocoris]KPA86490.1 chaperone protein DNAJ putatative [Leptomonas pyrrhocoris]|eukprot:XP_015664928.1 chaperone protein DNAJ putatative [Leptomonas pyrrhocoris]